MEVKAHGLIEKAAKLSEGEVDVVVTTPAWDSYDERILPEGVNYKDYMKGNNVILWAHDGYNLPIGNATKMWLDGKKLMARAKFYLKDDFPAKVYQYVLDGVIKAVSIGGSVEQWGEDGRTIEKLTMKEFSFCSVPANNEALVTAKSINNKQKAEFNGLARAYARKVLVGEPDQVQSQIKVLKSLVATLEEVAMCEPGGESAANKNIRVVLRSAQAVDHQAEQVIKVVKKGITQK